MNMIADEEDPPLLIDADGQAESDLSGIAEYDGRTTKVPITIVTGS